MSMKKILAGLLIGAFAFGVTVGNVSAATKTAKDTQAQTSEMKQPPKDSNGNPLPPPDKKDDNNKNSSAKEMKQPPQNDGKNPPEPPKDSNGNPLPPPDKKDDGNKNSQQQKANDKIQKNK